jgi:hypothetical protein
VKRTDCGTRNGFAQLPGRSATVHPLDYPLR